MAHLEIGTFGESQGDLPAGSNYLEDGAKGVATGHAATAVQPYKIRNDAQ